jgi:hypothetical protein
MGLILHLCLYMSHGRIYFSCGHRHDDSLYGADFFFAYPFVPGDAKVVFNSGITTARHGGGQADDDRRSTVEYRLIPNRVVKIAIGFVLFGGQASLLLCLQKRFDDFNGS